MNILIKFCKLILIFQFFFLLSGCGTGFFNPDWSKTAEPDGKERARQNVREGRGIDIGLGTKSKGGDFLFASSNPMWRASLDTIDFMSLSTVDYAGGLIITDWYSDSQSSNESIKITIKFLDNAVRVDAMDIDIHKRTCSQNNNCVINRIESDLNFQIKDKILKKAAIYSKDLKERNLKKRPKKVFSGDNER